MDILNFISWIKGSRVVNSVDASQTLLPVGLKDPKRDDGYLAGAISVADFASAIVPTYTNCNIPIGENTLSNLTDGANNVAIGCDSLRYNTNGNNNVAIGLQTMYNNTGGYNTVAIGQGVLYFNNQGHTNVAIGNGALQGNTFGNTNVAIGSLALLSNTTGTNNIAIGATALAGSSTGEYNIAIGDNALPMNSTGKYNIAIGANASSSNYDNCIIIGRDATATLGGQFVIGSSAYPAGFITTEPLTLTKAWKIKINGVDYKIPLQVA